MCLLLKNFQFLALQPDLILAVTFFRLISRRKEENNFFLLLSNKKLL